MTFRVGIDVGGTFTDLLVTDGAGRSSIYKTLTTPSDPAVGVFDALSRAAAGNNLSLKDFLGKVDSIVHGTTITTNAVLTGEGARTGFITTKGFRDVLNMRRGLKERMYDSKYSPPPSLVPRRLIQVVEERIDVEGREITPLNEDDVSEALRKFKEANVEAVAVSFLWSFFNPSHEERVREICEKELPGVYVSLSCEILPQIRLYERNSTTALNAYVGPPLARYLRSLREGLREQGFGGTLLIMQSNGGVMSPELAARFASNTLLSGPAGGPVAGLFYGNSAGGFDDIVTIDMGGTSFDAALIREGRPAITIEGSVGGYRLASPNLDIHTIGAGGGSIASIDAGGLLRVGPKSAGAEPGPVCYGRGGTEPTVTDADLLLGYLDTDFFWGGQLRLDAEAAGQAIKEKIADKLGMDVVAAANGIYQVINNNMAEALQVVSVQQGYDPREFALVVAGGAGPIHASMIARELGMQLVITPRESSVFCAAGMLISDLRHDYVRTYTIDVDKVDLPRVNRLYAEMTREAKDTLQAEGIPLDRIKLSFSADLRYIMQFNEVEVSTTASGGMSAGDITAMVDAFNKRHDALYGYSMPGAPVELINLRVSAVGVTDKPNFERLPFAGEDASAALKGKRRAFFDGKFIDTPVYDGLKMGYGNHVVGPAIIEQPTTTIVVTPDYEVRCDEFGSYVMYSRGANLEELAARLRKGGRR